MKIPRKLYRTLSLDRAGINEAERTIELSISSEEPYRRSFGHEILDHSPHSVDMSKIMDGAPLLWNHDPDKHLGTIVSARIEGGKVRVIARIGENSDAEERWKDIKSGVLKKASVGYRITGMKKEGKDEDDVPKWRCSWCPHEATLTPLPADTTVGIGRSEETGGEIEVSDGEEQKTLTNEKSGLDETLRNENKRVMADQVVPKPEINVTEIENAAIARDRKRGQDIKELSGHFATNGLGGRKIDTAELADQFIREGKSVGEFQDAVVRGNFKEAKPVETAATEVGMSQKERGQFSFLRAIYNLGTGRGLQGLEKEASEAHAKVMGRDCPPNSFYVPVDVMRGAPAFPRISQEQLREMDFRNPATRALFSNVYSGAGAFVGTDLLGSSLIELLRNQMYVVQLGARTMSGLKNNVAIPKHTGGATASWLAEDSTITATQQTVGQLNLTPHKLAAATAFTEQLAMQSSVDAENFVRQDLMAIAAIARDLAAIAGTGVSGQPKGILAHANTTELSIPVTLSAAQSMTYANAVAFETNVALNNANRGKLGYLATPTVKNNAKLIAEIAAANSIPVWKNDQVNGYTALATNQVPTGTSVIFGNWDDLILADWADSNFFVDPYSLSLQGQIRVINRLYCDNGIRHATSFSVATN
jgi:HK97 family phage major capsid protein